MAHTITIDEVHRLAQLARLKLSSEEAEKYQKELSSILDYFEILNTVDVSGLKPTSQVTGLVNVMRKDVVTEQVAKPDDLIALAPNSEGRAIKVKRMI